MSKRMKNLSSENHKSSREEILANQLLQIKTYLDLANRYKQGEGVKQDLPKAIGFYQLAAQQNSAIAQHQLGLYYKKGDGIKINLLKSAQYLHAAIKNGNEDAKKDFEEVITLLYQQANQGNAQAQFNLGILNYTRVIIKSRWPERDGVEYLQLSASQNYPPAIYCMAICYENGFVVVQDVDKAVSLYKIASNLGLSAAKYNLAMHNLCRSEPHKNEGKSRNRSSKQCEK